MPNHMLTTADNPFSPFTQYAEWNTWDEAAGYHTNSYLARVVRISDELSEADLDAAYESAVDEIVQENVNGMYRKVAEPENSIF
jgi:hypothetical protein